MTPLYYTVTTQNENNTFCVLFFQLITAHLDSAMALIVDTGHMSVIEILN